MVAILVFLSSFFGSFSAYFLYHYFTSHQDSFQPKSSRSRALQRLVGRPKKPKGVVLSSPTPEEERKKEWEEAKKRIEEARQKMGVTEDYRKIKA